MPSPMPVSMFLSAAGLNRANHAGEPSTVRLSTMPRGALRGVKTGAPSGPSEMANHSLQIVRCVPLTVWVCR